MLAQPNFLSLPDIAATYRQGNAEWRVWPGQALESFIVRRVLPPAKQTRAVQCQYSSNT
jgi:hypothetical protein